MGLTVFVTHLTLLFTQGEGLFCYVVSLSDMDHLMYTIWLDGVEKNLVIILAAKRGFLLADSQFDFSEDNHTHTHTYTHSHTDKEVLCYPLRSDAKPKHMKHPGNKTTSYKVKGADQQTYRATKRQLTLQAFMVFSAVE